MNVPSKTHSTKTKTAKEAAPYIGCIRFNPRNGRFDIINKEAIRIIIIAV